MAQAANVSRTRQIVVTAMLTALAFVAVLIGRLIPNVLGFLSYDPKDAVIAIAGFMYGPLTAVIITVLVSLIEMLSISTTGFYGLLMNIVSTLAFVLPAALFYKRWRSMKGAIAGLVAGMVCMTVMMLLWNYIITPFYMGVERSVVAGMLASVFLPFNLVKSGVNTGLTLLLYKPIMQALRAAKLLPQREGAAHKYRPWPIILALVVLGVFIPLLLHLAGVF